MFPSKLEFMGRRAHVEGVVLTGRGTCVPLRREGRTKQKVQMKMFQSGPDIR